MKIRTAVLIADLQKNIQEQLDQLKMFQSLNQEEVNYRSGSRSWTILECIEHLNYYGDFYLPEIENRIRNTKYTTGAAYFYSGLLGNYFALMMLPKEKPNKMKTFKEMDPMGSTLDANTFKRFEEQLRKMQDLLEMAKAVDLNRTKTCISISKWIKLKLGDTFRVVIYHNLRHIQQADKLLQLQRK